MTKNEVKHTPDNADEAMLKALNGGISPSLIAAAPDLLEACKEAHYILNGAPSSPQDMNKLHRIIQSAIAKAEGGN